jgi:Co/Zn/Cd efflux system component
VARGRTPIALAARNAAHLAAFRFKSGRTHYKHNLSTRLNDSLAGTRILRNIVKMAWSKSTRITIMLAIDTAFFFLELGVGVAVGSLALMADAFHMVRGFGGYARIRRC